MKKSIIKHLKQQAKQLPDIPIFSMKDMDKKKGSLLITEGVLYDNRNKAIVADQLYSGSQKVQCGKVNHVERMKAAYEKGGDNAVLQYMNEMRSLSAAKTDNNEHAVYEDEAGAFAPAREVNEFV